MQIKDIKPGYKGKLILKVLVERIIQTGGPTVFVVSDGTGNLSTSTTTSTEISYVSGAQSSIQT